MIDLRSDTVTKPCAKMRELMAQAEVGDDVYGEDPTINQLEKLAAEKMGKEAALFCASGTMSNLIAVLTHTSRGDEIILEKSSHINLNEVGGAAMIAGVMPNTIIGANGKVSVRQLKEAIRPENIHYPKATLLCLENTSNFGGGTVYTVEETKELAAVAREKGLKLHIDGARIFNAAVYLKVSVGELVLEADSVSFCLSKGLGAPVGSVLVGTKDFIDKARKYRKMLGGGLRQAGIIARAGIYALENLVDRLEEDHENARKLALGLKSLKGIYIPLDTVQTNIVMVDIERSDLNAFELAKTLKNLGILVSIINERRLRFVTHRDVTSQDIDVVIEVMEKLLA
ncbi:MAG: low-specificity L-threonine aldolase [Clostridia bacterium]|nr:low-specificity L-threonine aldolase [Clostridia bacterium]